MWCDIVLYFLCGNMFDSWLTLHQLYINFSWISRFLKACSLLCVGPESLLRKSSNLGRTAGLDGYLHGDDGDVVEAHEWKCVRTVNGIFFILSSQMIYGWLALCFILFVPLGYSASSTLISIVMLRFYIFYALTS